MNDKAKWLADWFARRNQAGGEQCDIPFRVNYFEAGLVDSFAVIELIAEVEERFGIRFNENHFQDRRFSTIEGLSTMIEELSESKNSSRLADEQ